MGFALKFAKQKIMSSLGGKKVELYFHSKPTPNAKPTPTFWIKIRMGEMCMIPLANNDNILQKLAMMTFRRNILQIFPNLQERVPHSMLIFYRDLY